MSLVLLPTTGVGSFPKPPYVKNARGTLDDTSKRATKEFIQKQEALGVDVLVDGEFYVGDMATDYARALGLPVAGWTESYDNRFWKKGIVDRELKPTNSIRLEQFLYAQSLTQKPVKAMLTGPETLANWNFNQHYKTREALIMAWAEVNKHAAKKLEQAGAKYIQIDEPAIAERPWEADLLKHALRHVTDGLTAYTITHICYGEFPTVYHRLGELSVQQVDIELANELDLGIKGSRLLQLIKENPLTKTHDVAVGVIDVRPGTPVETVDTVVQRIYTALNVLAPTDYFLRRIWIKPDCGFRTTKDQDVAYAKMEALVTGVRKVRSELTKQL